MFILVKQKNDGDNFFPNQSYECHIQKLTVLVVEKRICPLDEDSGDATKHASKREPEFPSFSFRPSSCSCSWLPRALRACRRFPEIRSKAVGLHCCLFPSCSLLPCYIPFTLILLSSSNWKTVKFFHPPFQDQFPSYTLLETPCSRCSPSPSTHAGISQFPGSNSGYRDLSSPLSSSQTP